MFGKILLISALALIAWAVVARASHGAGPEARYTVKPGDTLWAIAARHYAGDPHLGETAFGNAAYFDATRRTITCHKGNRFLLMGSEPAPTQYAVGRKGSQLEGVWRDAEDGVLSNNATATGTSGIVR